MLALMIVLLMPLIVAPLIMLGRRLRRLSRDSQDRVADASALAGETINAVQTVQSFNLEPLQTQRFNEAVEHSFAVARAAQPVAGLAHGARQRRSCSARSRSCCGSARARCSRAA